MSWSSNSFNCRVTFTINFLLLLCGILTWGRFSILPRMLAKLAITCSVANARKSFDSHRGATTLRIDGCLNRCICTGPLRSIAMRSSFSFLERVLSAISAFLSNINTDAGYINVSAHLEKPLLTCLVDLCVASWIFQSRPGPGCVRVAPTNADHYYLLKPRAFRPQIL